MLVNSASAALILAVALPAVSARSYAQVDEVTVDFGSCNPAIAFEGKTFRAVDTIVAEGQQATVNPFIITNHVCDQLSGVCEANAAAQSLCLDVQAEVGALGMQGQDMADIWNELITGGTVPKSELRRRAEKHPAKRQTQIVPCSADAWIDNCTGWLTKRDEPAEEPAPVVKRSEVKAAPVKKSEIPKARRQVAFIACSADAWIDDCTGWP